MRIEEFHLKQKYTILRFINKFPLKNLRSYNASLKYEPQKYRAMIRRNIAYGKTL